MEVLATAKIPLDEIIEARKTDEGVTEDMVRFVEECIMDYRKKYGIMVELNGVLVDDVINIEFDPYPDRVPEGETVFRIRLYENFRRFLASYDFTPRKGDYIRLDCMRSVTGKMPEDYNFSMRISVENEETKEEAQ